jgi:hypothetical protein
MLDPAAGSLPVPAMVAAAGERGARRFIDFFTANIRNPNTGELGAIRTLDLYRGPDMNTYVMYQWNHNCLARIGY